MSATRAQVRGDPPLAQALIDDLGAELSRRLWDGSAPSVDAPEIRRVLSRLAPDGRRRELERFVHHVAALPPEARRDFAIAVHPVQVRSKLWLIEELAQQCELANASLLVLGGWYGILPLLVNWRVARPPPHMVCVDFDPAACRLGERVVGSLFTNVEYRRADVMELDYRAWANGSSTVVINTICEHLSRLAEWWGSVPPGQLVVLQSNDYRACPDHVSCVENLDEFKRQAPMSELFFEGVLPLHMFNRYMLIGRR